MYCCVVVHSPLCCGTLTVLCGSFIAVWCFYRCVVDLLLCGVFIVVWWFYRRVVVLSLCGGFIVV